MISPAPLTGPPPAAGPAPPASQAPRSRVPAWIVWSLRVTATLHLAGVLGQAVIGGLFVTGEVDLLTWHNVNAGASTALVGLQLAAAVALWRPARGPAWPLWVSAVQLVLMNAQVLLGMQRMLAPHVPLAMVIFGVAVSMTAWTWRTGRGRS
ncbi:hypothetical protein ACLQ2R_27130 [Streptosporangium sp. DT93]|uniref:hypothetical protein n=1 Tax=Streptosporangium sp. DT93 TaxID=3393428 RepID=UPI003CE986CE